MEIYLMQHGQAFSKEADPERSLSPEGEIQVAASAEALARIGVGFDLVVASPKKRALQTAEIVAERLGYPLEEIKITETLQPTAPAAEALAFLKAYEDKGLILLAGHLPSLGEIASDLLSEGSKIAIRFEMGGVCRIDIDMAQGGSGELKYYLTPDQLRLIAK
ncbi:MAG: phosphohistidine phosphatase SixA [Proteobacteria bacterium]|nr:phosphohistidine phosphatase SixA [Pseudomonadota bacterium]NIS71342.1 phosphohistidine phosphatase SixA [Pseudomonadota bacterium]